MTTFIIFIVPDIADSLQAAPPDTTPPTITYTRQPIPNSNGWNNGPVTIRFMASDSSGIRGMSTYSRIVVTDGYNQSVTWSATDMAGNTRTVLVCGINIDTVSPDVVSTVPSNAASSVAADTPITVTFSESVDAASAMAGLTLWDDDVQVAGTVRLDGPGTASISHGALAGGRTYTVRADGVQDLAGNPMEMPYSWSFTAAQQTDTAAPIITYTRLPAANANGWNNGPVTVTFTATDDESGLATAGSYTKAFNADGAGQSVTWSATDNAGNTASVVVGDISIDTVAPAISGAPTTAPNGNGWYASDVVVHFTATDAGSGIASVTPDVTIAKEGTDLSAAGSATDRAGNMASVTVGGIKIDRTPPAVTSTVPGSGTGVAAARSTTAVIDANTPISATFSEPVDVASVIAGLTLWDGNKKLPGTVTYDSANRMALLAHAALSAGKTYTVRVEGVKDLAGNAMSAAYVWSFSVAAPTLKPTPTPKPSPTPVLNAAIASAIIPDAMTAGCCRAFVVTVKNTGTATWSAREGYALAGLGDAGRFGSKTFPLFGCCQVKPGKLQTFFILIKAPEQAGKYTLQYQMSCKGTTFGEKLTRVVQVTAKPRWNDNSRPASDHDSGYKWIPGPGKPGNSGGCKPRYCGR